MTERLGQVPIDHGSAAALAAHLSGARRALLDPLAELLLDAAPPLSAGTRMLEIGASVGLLSPGLRNSVEAVRGTLTCVDEVRTTMRLVPSGARRVIASSAALPFEDGAFDVVLGTYLLCDRDSTPTQLFEMSRVLRVGGTLILTVPLHGTLRELREMIVEACELDGDEAALRTRLLDAEHDPWTAETLERVLDGCALRNVGPIAVEERVLSFDSGAALVASDAVALALMRMGGPFARVFRRSERLRAEVAGLFDTYFDREPKMVRMCTGVLHAERVEKPISSADRAKLE